MNLPLLCILSAMAVYTLNALTHIVAGKDKASKLVAVSVIMTYFWTSLGATALYVVSRVFLEVLN